MQQAASMSSRGGGNYAAAAEAIRKSIADWKAKSNLNNQIQIKGNENE